MSNRTVLHIVTATWGLVLLLAPEAAAAPTDTQSHGGATNEVRESSYNFRDSIHDMPPLVTEGTWCCQVEVRGPDVVARPQIRGR